MTTLTALSDTRQPRALVTIVPDASRRGRITAAGFGALTYFGLSTAFALVLSGSALTIAQVVALGVAVLAGTKMVGATDRRSWLIAAGSVVGAIAIVGVAAFTVIAIAIWGPLAP